MVNGLRHGHLKAAGLLNAQHFAQSAKGAINPAHKRLQYSGKTDCKQRIDGHDLLTLFHAAPEDIRRSLAADSQEDL